MKISKIELSNYRKYKNQAVLLAPGINIICGDNAAGKSTILEAVHYLITLRTTRNVSDDGVIRVGAEETVIYGEFNDEKTQKNAIVLISKYYKKMSLDGVTIKKASEYVGFSDVVSFGTEDVDVISGSPLNRRKMMDLFFSQYDSTYLEKLREYKNILKERNCFLKDSDFTNKRNVTLLNIIDNKLEILSTELTFKRHEIVKNINDCLSKVHYRLSGEKEKCLIKYAPTWNVNKGIEQLIEARNKDYVYKTTTIGPHRDDYIFYINGNNLSKYGSQGQKKTSMLSFKLSCVELLKSKKQRNPIVLLDDVFGELDSKRHNSLLQFLENDIQTIITTPSLKELRQELIDKANIIYLEKEEV